MMGLELFTWRTLMVLLKAGKFGQWYSSEILTGTTILPEETKAKMRACWRRKESNNESEMIYDYVQQKIKICEYTSWDGWKPMDAVTLID
jgi:hypothetical protein